MNKLPKPAALAVFLTCTPQFLLPNLWQTLLTMKARYSMIAMASDPEDSHGDIRPVREITTGNTLETIQRWKSHRARCCAGLLALVGLCVTAPARADVAIRGSSADLAKVRRIVDGASATSPAWTGPRTGPAGIPGKTVAIVAEDLRNGGILGVAQGISEAAGVLRWHIRIFDAGGTPGGRGKAVADALAVRPDGMILVGADAEKMANQLKPFTVRDIPIVGWHVGPRAGRLTGSSVAINVSTDPLEVARVTAMAAIADSGGRAGVVIFTDSNFRIAMAKANAMAEEVRTCKGCALLEMCDVPISKSGELMPGITRELLARYGRRWTHALAINDIYFDYAVPELTNAGRSTGSLKLLSAGDGSAAAFLRIQAGLFQTGTVAEPLNLHGWQLVDELNRLLAHRPIDGYVVPVHLVTPENIAHDGGPRLRFDPDNGYRDIYRHIWGVR